MLGTRRLSLGEILRARRKPRNESKISERIVTIRNLFQLPNFENETHARHATAPYLKSHTAHLHPTHRLIHLRTLQILSLRTVTVSDIIETFCSRTYSMPYLPEFLRHKSFEVLLEPSIQDGVNKCGPNYGFDETWSITRANTPEEVRNLILSRRSIALLTQFYNRQSISRLLFLRLSTLHMRHFIGFKSSSVGPKGMCAQLRRLCMFGMRENSPCLSPEIWGIFDTTR